MTHTKKQNGTDTMNELTKKQKLIEFRKQEKTIERRLKDNTSIEGDPIGSPHFQAESIELGSSSAEAKLLLHTLIYHFDGFARQQQIINAYMSSKYHWGNKRTARVLEKLAEIGVIDRSKSGQDNWTLFFVVKGFIEKCRERIQQAMLAIKERLSHCRLAILSINCIRKVGFS